MTAVVVVLAVAVVLLGVLVVGLLRSHAEILRTLHELGADLDPDAPVPTTRRAATGPAGADTGRRRDSGTEAHDVAGTLPDGSAAGIAVRDVKHDTVLAFLSTTCATCAPFWEDLSAGVDLPDGARLVVVVQDEDSSKKVRRLAGDRLLVVASTQAWEDYDVPGSPHFAYVDGPSGRVVGEGTGEEWAQVADLIEQAGGGRPRGSRATGADDGDPADLADPSDDPDHRDNPTRIDAELLASGIGPGHPSLFAPVDDQATEPSAAAADVEAG